MLDKLYIFRQRLFLAVAVLFLNACSTTTLVKGEFPEPLIEQLPISVAVNYSDEFKQYVYKEEGKNRANRSVDFGEAQVALFTTMFSSMFKHVEFSSEVVADLNISPEILDFQYTIPRETKVNIYEVWLKYRIKITDQSGEEVDDLVIKGYGKTPTALLKSPVQAFDTATKVALRDVGAQLAIGFKRQPSIRDFLKNVSSIKDNSD